LKAADVARGPFGLLKATIAEWQADRAPRHAAALAYHTLFAIAPLLVISVGVAGFVLGPAATRENVVGQVLRYTGSEDIAALVQTMIEQSTRPAASIAATVAGVLMLLWGASNLFGELKKSLNDIWSVPLRKQGSIVRLAVDRAVALAMVMGTGALLLASLVLTTALAATSERLAGGWVTQVLAFIGFYAITLLIFAAIYRFLPDVRIAWRDVWVGAAITALLFSIGRLLIGLYLGFSSAGSAFGAAGSLVVVLLWIFYSAQIFFFGAEFTQVFARSRGSRTFERERLDAPVEEAAL